MIMRLFSLLFLILFSTPSFANLTCSKVYDEASNSVYRELIGETPKDILDPTQSRFTPRESEVDAFRMTEAEILEAGRILDKDFKEESGIKKFFHGTLRFFRLMRQDPNLPPESRQEMNHRMMDEIAKFKEIIDFNMRWFNIEISSVIRDMRKRRLNFQQILLEGDAYKASLIYNDIYTANQVALSFMVRYSRSKSESRDAELQANTSLSLLRALTRDPNLKDIYKKVDDLYARGTKPSAPEILNILDQIIARTSSEIRYIEWFMHRMETDAEIAADAKSNLDYIRGRWDPKKIDERFELDLLPKDELGHIGVARDIENGRPQITAYWMKRIAQGQRKHSRSIRLKSVFLLEKVKEWISKAPPALRKPLLFLARMDYNSYVIDIHIDSIEAVLLARKSVRLQVLQNRIGITKHNTVQLLETLARLSSDMKIWNELREEVKALEGSGANYAELLKLMVAAEAKVADLGFLSTTKSPSTHDHIMGWVIPGGGAVLGLGYANRAYLYEKWGQVAEYYEYILASVQGLF